MKRGSTILLALAAVVAIPGCKPDQGSQTHLTVTGPRAGIERFIALEEARTPPLSVSQLNSLPDGRSRARFGVPAEYGGKDLVRITREALDAGLTYELEIAN